MFESQTQIPRVEKEIVGVERKKVGGSEIGRVYRKGAKVAEGREGRVEGCL